MDYKESEVGKIPVHWEIRQLSEIGEIVSGGTPNTKIEEYWNGNIPWITPKDLSGFTDRYIYSGERNITELGLENSSAKLLPRNTVLFSSRAPIGYVALAGDNLATNQGFKSIICDDKKAYPLFIYYLLKSKKNDIENIAGGSTFKEVSGKVMKEFKVQIPPLTEQKAIANILSTLDEKIETNNQINEKLEEMAQALFKHWFVDFEFPNENGEPYKSSGGEMVESELGMIPKGWEVGKLGELVEISNKSIKPQEYPEKFFEHYSIPAFDNGKTPEFQKGKEIKSNKYVINNHVVLVSKLNPSTKRIWKPITQTKNAICSTEFIVYMAKKGNILSYVFEYLNNEKFQGVLTANATGSTGSRQRVKPKETLNYKVVLPPLKLMQQFSRMIEPMHLEIGSNMIENQKIKGLRDILLPKLMSGEIRVPLDNNEVDQS
ncbi:restriction endonuclease subunit S [Bacillus smithii]|jgi:type I restriction enzyme, S subunit|uniref:restriction endonuclease subunit S n=1 Tax=Bacillus smithii TaxID=1479 RepID=UPI002E20EEC3|nr:restriction endonuclease subunit S [Bacillus smithii]MED1456908.1 restriction endonuclease subunit S [Bacillus smithii]